MSERTKRYSSGGAIDSGLRTYVLGVYNYMCAGLAISAIAAFLTAYLDPLRNLMFSIDARHVGFTPIGIVVSLSPLLIGMYFLAKQGSLTIEKGKNLFWVYSALNGISLSALGIIYTGESITLTFLVCAALFAGMSIYGHSSKRDLTAFGSFLIMGLMGLILASLANLFLRNSVIDFVTSAIGVLVFTGLIAYDTQKIKNYYYATLENNGPSEASKAALVGAFILYLDVINLFVYLLRFFGVRRKGSE